MITQGFAESWIGLGLVLSYLVRPDLFRFNEWKSKTVLTLTLLFHILVLPILIVLGFIIYAWEEYKENRRKQ